MTRLTLTDVFVELHVPDFGVVREFYGKLGFKEVWSKPPIGNSGYLVMKRDTSILTFYCGNEEVYEHEYFKKFPKNTIRGYGVEITIHISNMTIESYYKNLCEVLDRKYFASYFKKRTWNKKEFRLVDPFGYYLTIREKENILYK